MPIDFAMGGQSKRVPRPLTGYFKDMELVKAWKDLLNLRDPGFSWDGSRCEKPPRGTAVNEDGLMLHAAPLTALLKLCPSGFPSHSDLRKGFILVQKKFHVFDCSEANLDRVAAESANTWRTMTRDVYTLKKNSVEVEPDLKKLVDLIVLRPATPAMEIRRGPSSSADASSCAAPDGGLHVADVEAICLAFHDASDDGDDVHIVETHAEEPAHPGSEKNRHVTANATRNVSESDGEEVLIAKETCRCPECMKKASVARWDHLHGLPIPQPTHPTPPLEPSLPSSWACSSAPDIYIYT